jgi:LysM repeat protein
MKRPKFFTRKKLRAATARRSLGLPEMDEMSEPNMKLSRALLIVLMLHVVAVAGIVAFNSIKAREGSFPAPAPVANANNASAKSEPVMSTSSAARHDESKVAHSSAVAKDEHKSEHAKTADTSGVSAEPGKTYLVVKGDNPVTIAKKLKVPYDDLLALNHIDDPHKLQIGQKLLVPKATKPKKPSE